MCGRFTLAKPTQINKRFDTSNKLPMFQPSFNMTPSQTVPTITRNSPNKITMMSWGLMFNKNANTGVINIRSESTKEKPFFKHFLLSQRCLIVADGFYEWGTVNLEGKDLPAQAGEKYPFYFYLKDKGILGFAGIYNDFNDAEGKPYYTCAILTTTPNTTIKKVHNRMPVIIKKEKEDLWLNPQTGGLGVGVNPENNILPRLKSGGFTASENDISSSIHPRDKSRGILERSHKNFDKLYNLLTPYPATQMKMHLVSKRVNSPKNDDKDLISPLMPD